MEHLLLSVAALFLVLTTSSCYGDSYTALEGELNISVDLSSWNRAPSREKPGLVVARILNEANETVVWKSLAPSIALEQTVMNVSFPCGVVDRAGLYRFQLWNEHPGDNQLITSRELSVRWPAMSLQVPSQLVNYRSEFAAKLEWTGLKCYPLRNSTLSLYASVVFCGQRNDSFSGRHVGSSTVAIDSRIWQTSSIDVIFGCDILTRPGFYRVVVVASAVNGSDDDRMTAGDGEAIAISWPIHVTMNPDFRMQVRARQAVPCGRELHVECQHPQCAGRRDLVRLYGKSYASDVSASISQPFQMHYITEKVVRGPVVSFSCLVFEPHTPPPVRYDAFCFRYVNTAPDNQVIDISQICIPAHSTSIYSEPYWGPWSEFSECTSKCGTGVRYRYRFCVNPAPQYRGSFCVGNPIETISCQLEVCPSQSTVSPLLGSATLGISQCRCGCSTQVSDNFTLTVATSDAACPFGQKLEWRLKTQESHQIQMDLDYLRLDCDPGNQLQVYDGGSIIAPLVARLTNESISLWQPILTRSSSILVQIDLRNKSASLTAECVTGFIAVFRAVSRSETELGQLQTSISNHRSTITLSPAMPILTALTFLGAILSSVAVLIFVYSGCGLGVRHDERRERHDGSQTSLWSDADDQRCLLTTATPATSTEELPADVERAFHHTKRRQVLKSLPASPFSARKCDILKRSWVSTAALVKCGQYQQRLGNQSRMTETATQEEIELATVKVLNKVDADTAVVVLDVALSRTTISYSTVSIPSHSDQEFELDYYDLDVRNAGDVPDSFLRCLGDDSTYWDNQVLSVFAEDLNCNSTVNTTR